MSVCDLIENWDETAFSGEGGRLDQIQDIVNEIMESYGFEGVDVVEMPGLMDSDAVAAMYDPSSVNGSDIGMIYVDPDYLAGNEITAKEAVYLAIHESIHAMDAQEDGELDIGELDVVGTAFGMTGDATDDCDSEPPESRGDDGGDTGGW